MPQETLSYEKLSSVLRHDIGYMIVEFALQKSGAFFVCLFMGDEWLLRARKRLD